jgi:hypothetical protein
MGTELLDYTRINTSFENKRVYTHSTGGVISKIKSKLQ